MELLVGRQPYPFADACSYSKFYIIEIVKYINMDFYSILRLNPSKSSTQERLPRYRNTVVKEKEEV